MNRINARKAPMKILTSMDGIRNEACILEACGFGRGGSGFPANRRISNGAYMRDFARWRSRDHILFDIQRQPITVDDMSTQYSKAAK